MSECRTCALRLILLLFEVINMAALMDSLLKKDFYMQNISIEPTMAAGPVMKVIVSVRWLW